jgi:DNA-binding CsgD family transcriptional regulator/pimeloyl-ACP methyl ester carboxylesterase
MGAILASEPPLSQSIAAVRVHGRCHQLRGAADLRGEQLIRFFTHRGGRVAYGITGWGPPLLLDVGRAHHLEAFWQRPAYRQLVQRLSQRFMVVRWDRPGFGLSDRHRADLSPQGEDALIDGLIGQLGSGEVAAVAAGDAGPPMMRFAARHPGRVSRLGLFGTATDGRALVSGMTSATLELLAGAPAPAIHDAIAAVLAIGSEPDVGPWLASALETSAGVPAMAGLVARLMETDVTGDAAFVRAPTIVLHRAGDPVVSQWTGRAVASRIPGAEFVALDGSAHLVYAGDTDAVVNALSTFFLGDADAEPRQLSHRELEVAHMVTLGLTNAEIARQLSIRPRTVDAHLEHIRVKLGVRSRAQIAAWAVDHQPQGLAWSSS